MDTRTICSSFLIMYNELKCLSVWVYSLLQYLLQVFKAMLSPEIFSNGIIASYNQAGTHLPQSAVSTQEIIAQPAGVNKQTNGSILKLFKHSINLTYEQRINYKLYFIRSGYSCNERQAAGRVGPRTQRRPVFSR